MEDSGLKLDTGVLLYRLSEEAAVAGALGMKPSVMLAITRSSLARQLEDSFITASVQDAYSYFLKPLAVWTTSSQSSTRIRVSKTGVRT